MIVKPKPTSAETVMRENDFITSKTDLRGRITYCNEVFMEFAKYSEEDLLGSPHSMIRHPDMPRAIFQLLWETIQSGKELNSYVKNMASDGSFYWVFANVTPVFDKNGKIVGYYSVRRKPRKEGLAVIIPLYKELREIENKYGKAEGLKKSTERLNEFLKEKEVSYEKFILSI